MRNHKYLYTADVQFSVFQNSSENKKIIYEAERIITAPSPLPLRKKSQFSERILKFVARVLIFIFPILEELIFACPDNDYQLSTKKLISF